MADQLGTVCQWRRTLGVRRMNSEGTRRVIRGHIAELVAGRDPRMESARDHDGVLWTDEEVALVGVLPDRKVARRTGRTRGAVKRKRQQMILPSLERERCRRLPWTA